LEWLDLDAEAKKAAEEELQKQHENDLKNLDEIGVGKDFAPFVFVAQG
jgi:hypothetical protein